ncbi:MAG: hypothetical protein K9N10_21090 [Deltaproteobacteria bacterium]|nr:hypothetical protein [Deltaproteobacteria bacterium]
MAILDDLLSTLNYDATMKDIRQNAAALIKEKGRGKRVAIVGRFPFIPKVREIAWEVRVMKKNPKASDLQENAAENLIPRADVVAITGMAPTNPNPGTFALLENLGGPRKGSADP